MKRFQELRTASRSRSFILAFVFAVSLPFTAYLRATPAVEAGKPLAASVTRQEPPVFGEIWARTELYFGVARPDGQVVSDSKFKRFLDQEITPRFPDGLTQLSGFGQFRNSGGQIIQENAKVVILLYPLDDADASSRIEAIRDAYKRAFQQESVLRVDSRAGVSF